MTSPFYPTIASRSTQHLSIQRTLFQIHNDESAIQKLEMQLSTGRRISSASEDPSAAIRALAAQRQLEFKNQIVDNIKSAQSILSASESTLAQSQAILTEMRGIAVAAADNTTSPEEQDALATQVSSAIQKLLELGNSKFRDQYLFAGSRVDSPPLRPDLNSVKFAGTAQGLQTFTDFASTVAANVTAQDAFGVRSSQIVGSVDLNPSLLASTRLSELNHGAGARLSSISLEDGVNTLEVDLSNAHSLDDVKRTIESQQLGSRDLKVTLSTSGLTVDYTDGLGGILRIEEVGSGITAGELGIRTTSSSSTAPIVGADLDPIATSGTLLSQLFGGAGISPGTSFVIRQNNRNYVINTTLMNTVEDLINGIHRSGAQVIAGIDSTGKHLTVQSVESGTELSIGENGSNLASQLGLRTMDGSTPVARLNFGQGIFGSSLNQELILTRVDGTEFQIDLDGVQTVADVIDRINNHVANFDLTRRIVASFATTGNGLVLTSPSGAQQISVRSAGGSQAAIGLGLVPRSDTSSTGATSGTNSVIQGIDVSGVEVEGAFTSLIRLRAAIEQGNTADLERIVDALNTDVQRMAMARGVMGARQQSLDIIQQRTEDQTVQLKEVESNELDADLAQTISDLTARQAALQASLQLMGRANQLTLFNYL